MASYRLYFIGPAGKRFHASKEFEATDDDLAIALVEDARGQEEMELWCGDKMVKAWNRLRISHSDVQ